MKIKPRGKSNINISFLIFLQIDGSFNFKERKKERNKERRKEGKKERKKEKKKERKMDLSGSVNEYELMLSEIVSADR
jgi:hypothetical protein